MSSETFTELENCKFSLLSVGNQEHGMASQHRDHELPELLPNIAQKRGRSKQKHKLPKGDSFSAATKTGQSSSTSATGQLLTVTEMGQATTISASNKRQPLPTSVPSRGSLPFRLRSLDDLTPRSRPFTKAESWRAHSQTRTSSRIRESRDPPTLR